MKLSSSISRDQVGEIKRQIIGLGGGGFSSEDNPLLDLYILASSGKPNPKICFLATASGDNGEYIQTFMDVFSKYPCNPSYLETLSPRKPNIDKRILEQDIIYVGGGNTKSMLALWKEWGIDKALVEAYHKGVILAGMSAGMVCWFREFLSDSYPKKLKVISGLSLLDYSACAHYTTSERSKQETFHRYLKQAMIVPGFGIDDGAAVHFINEALFRAVASNAESAVYQITTNLDSKDPIEVRMKMIDLQANYADYIVKPLEKVMS